MCKCKLFYEKGELSTVHCIFILQVIPFMFSLNGLLYRNCLRTMLGPVCTFCTGSEYVNVFFLIGWVLLLQIVHEYGKFSVRNPRSIDHDHLIVIISSLWIRPQGIKTASGFETKSLIGLANPASDFLHCIRLFINMEKCNKKPWISWSLPFHLDHFLNTSSAIQSTYLLYSLGDFEDDI